MDSTIKKFRLINIVIIITNILLILFCAIDKQIEIFNVCLIIIALLSGLMYSVKKYKKKAANYYKSFMIIHFFIYLLDIVSYQFVTKETIVLDSMMYTFLSIKIIVLICLAFLAFAKDLGKEKTIRLAYIVLIGNALILVLSTIYYGQIGTFVMVESNVILSCLAISFVRGKYFDKEERYSRRRKRNK